MSVTACDAVGLRQIGRAEVQEQAMAGFVYIMTNRPSGTLYTGVTSDLAQRVWQHRNGLGSGFCRKHGLSRLVLVEEFEDISDAIVREKRIKKWNRAWKLNLIGRANPQWRDLWDVINC